MVTLELTEAELRVVAIALTGFSLTSAVPTARADQATAAGIAARVLPLLGVGR